MCDYPRKLCPDEGSFCPCTVFDTLFLSKYSEAAQLLRDHLEIIDVLVPTGEECGHHMRFGIYLITRLPTRLLNLALDAGFKEVVDVVLETRRQYPASYHEYRMEWAVASEFRGKCLWEHEYIDTMKSGEVPIGRKPYLRPRGTPAMTAAWEAWNYTERDRERDREAREREERWQQLPRVLCKPPSHALAQRK